MSFFNKRHLILAVVIASLFSTFGTADEVDDIVARSREMMGAVPDDEPVTTGQEVDEATFVEAAKLLGNTNIPMIDGKGVARAVKEKSANEAPWDDTTPALYVSLGMPAEQLRRFAEDAKERNYPLVFRGLMPDQPFNSIPKAMAKIMGGNEKLPEILLDPTAFKRHGIAQVPTFVIPRGKAGMAPIIYLGGTPTNQWIEENFDRAFDGPVKSATTFQIAEADLTDEITRRYENIDWEKQKKEALGRFWGNQEKNFVRLPEVKENAVYKFDPSIVITEQVKTPDGKIIARPGDTLNPLKAVRLTNTYIFFNAAMPEQYEFAKKYIKKNPDKHVRLIATEIPINRGWEIFEEVSGELGQQLYIAPRILVERMRIKAVPSVVSSMGSMLVIEEFKPGK
jgi:conjugal transfer pilus assembly protein TraW